MKRIATSMIAIAAFAGLVASGCGSSSSDSTTVGPEGAREGSSQDRNVRSAAGRDNRKTCPERLSLGNQVVIINRLDRYVWPIVTGVNCSGWSGTGNPTFLNGRFIQNGLRTLLHIETATVSAQSSRDWTMNIGTDASPILVELSIEIFDGATSPSLTLKDGERTGEYGFWSVRIPDGAGGFVKVSVQDRLTVVIEKA